MIYCEDLSISNISVHRIGSKANNDGIIASKESMQLDDALSSLLVHYFVTPFKSNEYFTLYHETDISLNEVYTYVTTILDNPDSLHEQSVNLAKHLYENSNHPKIKAGEFYVVHFKDCILDGETVDAVGIFKSENKDTFLKVYHQEEGVELESQEGVNINKLDKGCMIFNTEKDNGYVVAVIDNTNKGGEAHYWIDDFLHLKQRQDEYFNTENVLSMCKNFVTKELPQHFDVSKADQVDMLNKSVKFFKEKDSFDISEFTTEVMAQSDIIDTFTQYKDTYQRDRDIEIADNFMISDTAVKKQARSIKSVIKLDRNFHIYVHGDRELIETGIDERGKFYKVYYNEES